MFLEPWKTHGISTTNIPQLFVRSPDLEKIPQEAVIHEIKDSSTGKKDLQRMAEWEGQDFGGMGIFHGMVAGMDFLCPAIFFLERFFNPFKHFWIEKVEDFFHIC